MRRILVVVALAGCAGRAATGPAWPRASARADDGGESLAPHQTHEVATSIEKAEDETKPSATPVIAPVIAPSAQVGGTVAPVATPAASSDEPITTEDIVIEVDD